MSFTKHENKIVYEKVLLVKIIHNSKDSLEKYESIKFRKFECSTGYSVLFFCHLKLISFLLFETNFVLVICSHVIWYVIQVYTAFNSTRTTKEVITTKRRRSFAFAFECRRSSQRTND